ncbi:BCCT family transporter [Pseudohongiella nitratireducens]|nr:BCCT family transporter [Pseudohongiella nitratireducens]
MANDATENTEAMPGQIETDYTIGQDNLKGKIAGVRFDIHNPVFVISAIAIVLFVFYTLLFPNQAESLFQAMFNLATQQFDWYFLTAVNIIVIFALFLVFSPYGKIRIGGPDATPDHSYPSWLALLFSAGVGIGLMYYGVAEPMTHFSNALSGEITENGTRIDVAPLGGAAGDTNEALRIGMASAIYHWSLHAWAVYGMVALSLAIFCYNKGLPLSIRSAFYPLLGDRVWGFWGNVIDTIAVFATLFGLATSLGLGAAQANAGLNELFGVPISTTTEVLLILGITAIAMVSVLRGLEGGVKVLSEINMSAAVLLALFVLVTGPTLYLLTFFWDSLMAYGQYMIPLSNPFGREDVNFSQDWTAFYWAWWISWSPFVGMFIARVSRGRTVREFLICVMIVPTLACAAWMAIFGGAAFHQLLEQGHSAVQEAALPLQLFKMLGELPLASITSFIGIVLVIIFFVTSSDSGSLVIDTITAGGKVESPTPQRVFWCIFEGAVAIALLLGGGLASLQSMVLSTGILFTAVVLIMCWSLLKGLQMEPETPPT